MRAIRILIACLLLCGQVMAGPIVAPGGAPGILPDANGLLPPNQSQPISATLGTTAPIPLGALNAYTTGLYALYGTLPVVSSYTGPLYTVRRETDGATFSPTGAGAQYNSAALALFAGASDLYVTTAYDISGNGHTITIPTAQQPKLVLAGAYPTFEFDGFGAYLPATSALSGWLPNVAGASVVALRKNDTLNATLAAHPLIFASTPASSARLTMGLDNTLGTDAVQGRRLDADALNRSGGFAVDNQWDTEVGRWDFANAQVYHSTTVAAETRTYQTGGSVSNTTSANIAIGNINGVGVYFQGRIAVIAMYQTALTDAQTIAINASLDALVPAVAGGNFALDWGAGGQSGTYTLVSGLTNYTVLAPDGSTPAAGNLAGDRYHHHTKIAVMSNGRIWVAASAAASSEEQGGQFSELMSTPAAGTAFSAPQVAVPSQSLPYQLTGTGDVTGTRIAYPRTFVTVAGVLYLVSAVDQVNTIGSAESYQQGIFLAATPCNADGTIGTTFVISSSLYTPLSGVSAIAYNASLAPAIYAAASTIGTWGGSAPGQPATLWFGTISQNGDYFNEPTTFPLNAAGTSLLRLYRKNTGNQTAWLYTTKSIDAGRTWGPIARTNVPSAITETTGLAIQNGPLVVVGNPQFLTGAAQRDPLYIATFSPTTGIACGLPLAVRQGLSNTPTYPNGQSGGAQYPGIATDGTTLYISYSITKQTVGMTTVPIASLTTCS